MPHRRSHLLRRRPVVGARGLSCLREEACRGCHSGGRRVGGATLPVDAGRRGGRPGGPAQPGPPSSHGHRQQPDAAAVSPAVSDPHAFGPWCDGDQAPRRHHPGACHHARRWSAPAAGRAVDPRRRLHRRLAADGGVRDGPSRAGPRRRHGLTGLPPRARASVSGRARRLHGDPGVDARTRRGTRHRP